MCQSCIWPQPSNKCDPKWRDSSEYQCFVLPPLQRSDSDLSLCSSLSILHTSMFFFFHILIMCCYIAKHMSIGHLKKKGKTNKWSFFASLHTVLTSAFLQDLNMMKEKKQLQVKEVCFIGLPTSSKQRDICRCIAFFASHNVLRAGAATSLCY